MPTIAIINLNNCEFDLTEYVQPMIYRIFNNDTERKQLKKKLDDYIWSVVKDHIEFVNTNLDYYVGDSIYRITNDFGHDPNDFLYHTQTSYPSPKKTLELIFCQPKWESYEVGLEKNMNKLASLFSLQHTVIENKCAVIAYSYDNNNNDVILSDVTANDIIGVVKRRYFHTGIFIKNNLMSKFYYQNTQYVAIGLLELNQTDLVDEVNFDLFGYNLKMISDTKTTDTNINEIATRIYGRKQIFGSCVLLNMFEDNIFMNLSMREAKRLNVLSYGTIADRTIDESTVKKQNVTKIIDGVEHKESIPVIWNKYIILNNRIKNYNENLKNICHFCKKTIVNDPIYCQKCFRMKYCSNICIQTHNHSIDHDCVKN